MKRRISVICLVISLLAPLSSIHGQSEDLNAIQTVVPFLTIAPDSRAGAMGDVGAATSPDIFSMHWNPAKYAFIDGEGGFGIGYSPWLRNLISDINISYLTGYYRIDDKQVVSASLLYSSLGEILFTDNVGNEMIVFRANEFSVDGAYSRKLSESLSGAIAMRFIYSNLTGGYYDGITETRPGISFAADVSFYYMKDISISNKDAEFSAGTNISNLGAKMSYTDARDPDFIPMNFKIGAGTSVYLDRYNKIGVFLDLNKLLVPTPPIEDGQGSIISGKDPNVSVPVAIFQSFADAPGGFKEELREISYSLGLEYLYNRQFAVRAGYFHEHATKGNRKFFTAGAGLKMSVFSLDFSYLMPVVSNNPLAGTLRFSLAFDFDAFRSIKS